MRKNIFTSSKGNRRRHQKIKPWIKHVFHAKVTTNCVWHANKGKFTCTGKEQHTQLKNATLRKRSNFTEKYYATWIRKFLPSSSRRPAANISKKVFEWYFPRHIQSYEKRCFWGQCIYPWSFSLNVHDVSTTPKCHRRQFPEIRFRSSLLLETPRPLLHCSRRAILRRPRSQPRGVFTAL